MTHLLQIFDLHFGHVSKGSRRNGLTSPAVVISHHFKGQKVHYLLTDMYLFEVLYYLSVPLAIYIF